MAEFFGRDLEVTFAGTGGSINLTEYQRGATFTPSGNVAVNTTGAAGYETRQVGVKDFTASYKGLMQSGTAGGVEVLCAFGELGTLTLSPEGTATGMRKYILPVISQGCALNLQYDALTELNISFVGNGTASYSAY